MHDPQIILISHLPYNMQKIGAIKIPIHNTYPAILHSHCLSEFEQKSMQGVQ